MRGVISLIGLVFLASLSAPAQAAKLGETCDGIAAIRCEEGLRCEHPTGQCSLADGSGTCEEEPIMCEAIFQPVCGCDGKTYDNDCVRKAEGVQRDHLGACAK
jgi:hypothetical protein